MPTWLAIVLGTLLALIVLLATAGMYAAARRQRQRQSSFEAHVTEANRALALAHATDRGWDPAVVEPTAREAFAAARPGIEVRDITLVQVIDLPGTDEDKAVFHIVTADGGEATIKLGRTQGNWVLETIS